uniref:Integrase core domain containing protein n=1 Tax=Solanum tuberosum TaxID=4113 RepID=M1DSJ7_SOLTU
MATLLQHVKPWMQHSITESEARMAQMMDQKAHAVHKSLDAFDLIVLERPPAPTIDMTTFQQELASLCADVVAFLAPHRLSQSAPMTSDDKVVMIALFGDAMPLLDSSHTFGKCHRSDRTSDDVEAPRLRKKERQQLEEDTRVSLLDKEMRQQWAREISVGPFGSVSTIEGTVIVNWSATDGVPSVDRACSEKPDPPTS